MDQQTVSWVFSGIGVTLILTVLGLLKFIFVPHPVIFITLEEKAFLTGYQRVIRMLILEFSAMSVLTYMAVFSTSFNNMEHPLSITYPYTENPIISNLMILIFQAIAMLLLISFLILSINDKLLAFCLKKFKKNKKTSILFPILFIIYLAILSSHFGYFINWILSYLNSSLSLKQKESVDTLLVLPTFKSYIGISIIFLLLYVLYRAFLQPMVIIFNKISTTVILATITLNNGTVLYNKYILRQSVDGNILIGDKPKPTEDCDKIMLPKSSILLIEFKRVYKSLGDKNKTVNRILLPPDFK
ncbi:hypothetical protein M5X11_12085 [Paenibacillus alginolyticus]|uniref:hypothetical protein n=1 Tax=Paenibacillus alginolyticus TaxID=59839 RepID=UPI0003FACDEB|nr:hypothetical protein [Paenibacillus alginolyticus]MCY9665694.1 hypothetical protein [Paenibacillus alginolyticus]